LHIPLFGRRLHDWVEHAALRKVGCISRSRRPGPVEVVIIDKVKLEIAGVREGDVTERVGT
jgi:hypothetical protein